MTIQRYSCDPETPGPCDHGGWVLFIDAEADKAKAVAEAVSSGRPTNLSVCAICEGEIFWHAFKYDGWPGSWQHNGDFGFDHQAAPRGQAEHVAEAVEKATKELRAEFVESLEHQFRRCAWYDDGWYRIDVLNSGCDYGDRLVKLKAWEKETQNEVECYRPIKPRSSGHGK